MLWGTTGVAYGAAMARPWRAVLTRFWRAFGETAPTLQRRRFTELKSGGGWRRGRDLNPGPLDGDGISSPAPWAARPPRLSPAVALQIKISPRGFQSFLFQSFLRFARARSWRPWLGQYRIKRFQHTSTWHTSRNTALPRAAALRRHRAAGTPGAPYELLN